MTHQSTQLSHYANSGQEDFPDDFHRKLELIVSNGHLSLAIALGVELHLFEALAKAGHVERPATPCEVAEIANVKVRYCQEWLCCMACGDVIKTDHTGQRFWIPKERLEALTGAERDPFLFASTFMIPIGEMFKEVKGLFRREGPAGIDYGYYSEFYDRFNDFSTALYRNNLVKVLIPMLHMEQSLIKGIEVLEVGCHAGCQVLEMAQHFPASHFTCIDVVTESVHLARDEAKKRGLANAKFLLQSAMEMEDCWDNKFDLITDFDACHDLTRPDVALKEMYRCLKPGGLLAVVEINGSGNCYLDKINLRPELSSFLYALSIFHCLPVGSNSEDALKLGAMWSVKKGKSMLEAAGFNTVSVKAIPFTEFHILYRARK